MPCVGAEGGAVLSRGNILPVEAEGYAVINCGSSLAVGVTQTTVGGDFRSCVAKNIDVGVAYEKGIISPEGLTDDPFTFDIIVRFQL